MNRLLIGVLGRAQRLYEVRIHACVVLSNHYHLLLSVETAYELARFIGYFQANLAKEAGRLHRWRGPFWHRRYQHVLVSNEEAAQIARLRYILANSCKENLVSSPFDWPGVGCARSLVRGEALHGLWIDRTQERLSGAPVARTDSPRFQTRESVRFEPIPCWRNLEPRQVQKRTSALVAEIEAETRARCEDSGTRPMGVRAILEMDPHDRPARSKWSAAPLSHCASQEARRSVRIAYSAFVVAFRETANRVRSQDLFGALPTGAFPPLVLPRQQARAPG